MPINPGRSSQELIPPMAWLPWTSGRYYLLPSVPLVSTNAALGVNTLRCLPFVVPNAVTLTRIGAEVTAGGDAGSKVRLGLYADDGTGRPGRLVIDAGQIAGDSATVQELTISLGIGPGIYYTASVVQSVTTTQPTLRTASTLGLVTVELGASIPTAGQTGISFTMSGQSGGLPDPFVLSGDSGTNPPRLFVKVG